MQEVVVGHEETTVILLALEANMVLDEWVVEPFVAFVTPVALPFALGAPRVSYLQQFNPIVVIHIED